MPKVAVNGLSLAYEIQGRVDADAPRVIFVHPGFGGPQSTLAAAPSPILGAIPQDVYSLVTYDRRCSGRSDYTLHWYTLEHLASDVAGLMDTLRIDRAIVVGTSIGGMVALQFALSYGDRLQGLALLSTGANLMNATAWGPSFRRIVERAKRDGDDAVTERMRRSLREPARLPPRGDAPPEVAKRLQTAHDDYLARLGATSDALLDRLGLGMIRNYAAFLDVDLSDRLDAIAVPTLVIHGTADTTVPFRCGEALRDRIEGAEFHAIPGAVHGILQYGATRRLLHDWLLGQAPARAAHDTLPAY